MEADGHGSDKPLIDSSYDYEYDEAHDVPVGTRSQTAAPRPVGAPAGLRLGEGGDYGYDEAHDFCARRSTEK